MNKNRAVILECIEKTADAAGANGEHAIAASLYAILGAANMNQEYSLSEHINKWCVEELKKRKLILPKTNNSRFELN